MGKRIVIIGGGHGTSVVLSSLKDYDFTLSAILSMADDGGSTGKLRKELGTSAVGDIRQCLVALSADPELAKLFAYRFSSGELSGHSLGNLILSAGELESGSISKSIEIAKKALGINADIIASTEDKCDLTLEIAGDKVQGVFEIENTAFEGKKAMLKLEPAATLSLKAQEALVKADVIIIAPGNLYCSILPALIVNGMAETIRNSNAEVLYICNLANKRLHTTGFSVGDYISEIERLSGGIGIDQVVYNTSDIPQNCLREGETQVVLGTAEKDYKTVGTDISDSQVAPENPGDKIAGIRSLVRHDRKKLGKVLTQMLDGST